MSPRSLVGVLLICAAILSPWLVRDWIPDESNSIGTDNRVLVPGIDQGTREKRNFSSVHRNASPQEGAASSKRIASRGFAKSVSTGARALFPGNRNRKVPESELSITARAKHTRRIENEMRRLGLNLGNPVFCRIFKEEREFELWLKPPGKTEFSLFRVYRICNSSGGMGPRFRDGDRRAPEGFYFVTPGRMIPESRYHMGFELGFPNVQDRFHGRKGREVMVHGKCSGSGSYSLTDGAIEEVYTIVASAFAGGQKFFRVHCFPFRMDDKRMDPKISQYPENDRFWANLKEGYDFFEVLRYPPDVTVSNDGNYRFAAK